MMLNLTVTLRNVFDTLQKIDPEGGYLPPLGPKPEGQSYEKKVGPEGSKNRNSVVQRLKNGQEMRNDLAITLCWVTFSYLHL